MSGGITRPPGTLQSGRRTSWLPSAPGRSVGLSASASGSRAWRGWFGRLGYPVEGVVAAVEVRRAHVEEAGLLEEVDDHEPRAVAVGHQAVGGVEGDAGDGGGALGVDPGGEADEVWLEARGFL